MSNKLQFKSKKSGKTYTIIKNLKDDIEGTLFLNENGKITQYFDGLIDLNAGQVQNIPPTANAGDDITVKEGSEVILNGNEADKDGEVKTVSWRQINPRPDIDEVILNANSEDTTAVTFTAPKVPETEDHLELEFMLEAIDDKGAKGTDTIKVTVTKDGNPLPDNPPAPPEPGKDQVYSTNNPLVHNGIERDIEQDGIDDPKYGKQDKYDKVIRGSHAGLKPRIYKITAAGVLQQINGRNRYYFVVTNGGNFQIIYAFEFGDKQTNTTAAGASDHNEGGQPAHRFGGRKVVIDLESQEVNFDVEDYHNVYVKKKEWNFKAPFPLKKGEKYIVVFESVEMQDGTIQEQAFIRREQDGKGNFKKVGPVKINPKPYWLGVKHAAVARYNGTESSTQKPMQIYEYTINNLSKLSDQAPQV
jgi:hypothetical protein